MTTDDRPLPEEFPELAEDPATIAEKLKAHGIAEADLPPLPEWEFDTAQAAHLFHESTRPRREPGARKQLTTDEFLELVDMAADEDFHEYSYVDIDLDSGWPVLRKERALVAVDASLLQPPKRERT